MKKEEINAFISKHKLTFSNANERILVVLKNSTKLIGFFDAQEPVNSTINKWRFTSLHDKKEHLINGEDIERLKLYGLGTHSEEGDDYIFRDGEYIKIN
jgi:hypothetical protein